MDNLLWIPYKKHPHVDSWVMYIRFLTKGAFIYPVFLGQCDAITLTENFHLLSFL